MDRVRAEIAALLVVVGANAAHRVLSPRQRLSSNLTAAALTVGMARDDGLTWSDLGLAREDVGAGVAWGAGAALGLGAAVACVAAVPETRRWLIDDRVSRLEPAEAGFELMVRIPLETAIAEELMFRSALFALASCRRDPLGAALTTSLAFGLWHVLPTLATLGGSSVGGHVQDRPAHRAGAVAAAVSVTAAAGLGLTWLRKRSGSVVAPIVAHAALNMSAFAVSRLVASRSDLRESS